MSMSVWLSKPKNGQGARPNRNSAPVESALKSGVVDLPFTRRLRLRARKLRALLEPVMQSGGCPLHTLVGPSQDPALTSKVGTFGQKRLIVVRAGIEDIQAHARTTERCGKADRASILGRHNIPVLTRIVATIDEVRLVIVRAAVKDVQAHVSTAKLS